MPLRSIFELRPAVGIDILQAIEHVQLGRYAEAHALLLLVGTQVGICVKTETLVEAVVRRCSQRWQECADSRRFIHFGQIDVPFGLADAYVVAYGILDALFHGGRPGKGILFRLRRCDYKRKC